MHVGVCRYLRASWFSSPRDVTCSKLPMMRVRVATCSRESEMSSSYTVNAWGRERGGGEGRNQDDNNEVFQNMTYYRNFENFHVQIFLCLKCLRFNIFGGSWQPTKIKHTKCLYINIRALNFHGSPALQKYLNNEHFIKLRYILSN